MTKDTEKNQWTALSKQIIRGFGGIKKTKRTLSTALMQKYRNCAGNSMADMESEK